MNSTGQFPVILLTGRPGIGKTTLIRQIVSRLGDRAGGFYTRDIRAAGQRTGFELVTLAGQTACLATKDPRFPLVRAASLGKYRVNLAAIETVAVPALRQALAQGQVVVIDEIGPMEILSGLFCRAVREILDSEAVAVGAIVQRSTQFTDAVKAHRRVQVLEVTLDNRAQLPAQVYAELVKVLRK